jgi:hypothetical protein
LTQPTTANAVFGLAGSRDPGLPPPTTGGPPSPPPTTGGPSPIGGPPSPNPGSPDRRLDAQVLAATTTRTARGQRAVRVRLSADEPVTVSLALTRRGATLAARRRLAVAPGARSLALTIPATTGPGTATLTTTIADGAGNARRLRQTIQIAARRHRARARTAALARPKVTPTGIELRQAGGSTEPLIATFKKARCGRLGHGFVLTSESTNGAYRLSADIDVWKGYRQHYILLRQAGSTGNAVFVNRRGTSVTYDSSVTVPGFPGGGAIAFTAEGDAVSIGGVFFQRDDMEKGVTVSGAMTCSKPRRRP